eukprot:2898948-Amphidinium_carterae.2
MTSRLYGVRLIEVLHGWVSGLVVHHNSKQLVYLRMPGSPAPSRNSKVEASAGARHRMPCTTPSLGTRSLVPALT